MRRLVVPATLAVTVCAALVVPGPASAVSKRVSSFFPSTAGQGTAGGQFNQPRDIAVRQSTGQVYVVDVSNNRIQRFAQDGTFERTWGIDVVSSGGAGDTAGSNGTGDFEICTIASQCKAGLSNAGNAAGTINNLKNGGMSAPQGVAVNQVTGDVYVRDAGFNRVNQYTADGVFVRSWGWNVDADGAGTQFEVCPAANRCQAGSSGAGAGQVRATTSASTGIAIAPASAATAGHVFVVDPGVGLASGQGRRIQEFDVGGNFVRAWGWNVAPTGSPGDDTDTDGTGPDLADQFEVCTTLCQAAGSAGTDFGRFQNANPTHVAVDGSGVVYASDNGTAPSNRIQRFDSTQASAAGLLMAPLVPPLLDNAPTTALKVADGDRLLVARTPNANPTLVVQEIDTASLTATERHVEGTGLVFSGVDLNAATGDLYLSDSSTTHRVYVADDDGAGDPDASIGDPTAIGPDGATVSGTVNPQSFPDTTYRFEVSRDGVNWQPAGAEQTLPVIDADVPVGPVTLTGLEANTLYRVRIRVTKGFNAGTGFSPEKVFLTDAIPPDATTDPVESVDSGSAYLRATVNPNGSATTYRFDYGPTAAYGYSVPVPAASLGSGGTPQAVVQRIDGLAPEHEYHYRVVATNAQGTTMGADHFFLTLATPGGGPAGRAYERVSAPAFGGVGVGTWYTGIGATTWVGTGAQEGDSFFTRAAYGSTLVDGGMAWAHDYALAERTPLGWQSRSVMTHAATRDPSFRMLNMRSATPDLSTFTMNSNGGLLPMFPELADWDASLDPAFVGNSQGRWEILAPTDDSQADPTQSVRQSETAISDDGFTVVGAGYFHGVAGAGDPTASAWSDRVAGRSIYVDDISSGLADTFAGNGVRSLVNVCTPGTMLPARSPSGLVDDQPCPDPFLGRDAHLISDRGAALQSGSSNDGVAVQGSLKNIVSRNGSRTFFMSPDPGAAGVPTAGCSGTDDTTSCPPQLYVRQRNANGAVRTRWISRPADGLLGTQDAALLGPALFEGATPDGDKVFFRTNSPLTEDDPNAGETAGPSDSSWDLYMYELPEGDDPAAGVLTRITRGPTGAADANGLQQGRAQGMLRFLSDDGDRVYFVTSAALPGAATADNGTITSAGGSTASTTTVNLYVYERSGGDESWRFVTQLPRAIGGAIATCASTGAYERAPLTESSPNSGLVNLSLMGPNCMRGTKDGGFVTFWTNGRLTPDDPDAASGDMYGYDANSLSLTRISRPQGGNGIQYPCSSDSAAGCYGDPGFDTAARNPLALLGVVRAPGERSAFFQSRARLVAGDHDDAYDVYQWRDGELSLVTSGASGTDGAFYKGNSADGKNVYFATRDRYSWQDVDAVLDVYTARVGSGIPEPESAPICGVLAGGCQGDGAVESAGDVRSDSPGGGDAAPPERKVLSVRGLSAAQRHRGARSGTFVLRVGVTAGGRVTAVVRARLAGRLRVVGRSAARSSGSGVVTLRVRLAANARRRLAAGRRLRLAVTVTQDGARTRSMNVDLKRRLSR